MHAANTISVYNLLHLEIKDFSSYELEIAIYVLEKNFAAVIILAIKCCLYLIMIFRNSTIHVSTSTRLLENNGLCLHNIAIQLATLKVY